MCKCNKTACGCKPKPRCDCKVTLDSKCITSVSAEFTCLPVDTGQTLNETFEAMDSAICQAITDSQSATTLVNVGTGAEIYKGVNVLGQRELKTILPGTATTVTEQTDTVTIGVDLGDLPTYSVANIGTGEGLYAGNTVAGDNTQFNMKSIQSSTLSISVTANTITIDSPDTSVVPALYVNNQYIPTYAEFLAGNGKGQGTLAKPYTDTVTYTNSTTFTVAPNTSIQNALDAYVGTGTRLAPQLSGRQIVVQNNNGAYAFPGDLNYSSLNLMVEGSIVSTTTGYLINMNNSSNFNATTSFATIELSDNGRLEIQGDGFINHGSTVATSTNLTGRQIRLIGNGTIVSNNTDETKILLSSDPLGTANGTTGFNNDGRWAFEVRCRVEAMYQVIYKIGGKSAIYFFGAILQSGTVFTDVETTLKAFHQTGGFIKMIDSTRIIMYGSNIDLREKGFVFEPTATFPVNFIADGVNIEGSCDALFAKNTNNTANFSFTNSESGQGLSINEVFYSTNLWGVRFTNNVFSSGNIDTSMADLTQGNTVSSINTIGANVIETLVRFVSRIAAQAVLPPYSAFINTKTEDINDFTTSFQWTRDITLPTT